MLMGLPLLKFIPPVTKEKNGKETMNTPAMGPVNLPPAMPTRYLVGEILLSRQLTPLFTCTVVRLATLFLLPKQITLRPVTPPLKLVMLVKS